MALTLTWRHCVWLEDNTLHAPPWMVGHRACISSGGASPSCTQTGVGGELTTCCQPLTPLQSGHKSSIWEGCCEEWMQFGLEKDVQGPASPAGAPAPAALLLPSLTPADPASVPTFPPPPAVCPLFLLLLC